MVCQLYDPYRACSSNLWLILSLAEQSIRLMVCFRAHSSRMLAAEILGQVDQGDRHWKLAAEVPPLLRPIYSEPRETTLDSFVKFIARRYKGAPVKTGLKGIKVPDFEKCSKCERT